MIVSTLASAQSVGTVNFPNGLDSSTTLFQAVNGLQSSLSAPLTAVATSMTLADASAFPTLVLYQFKTRSFITRASRVAR